MISKELLKLVLPYPQNEFVDFIKVNDEFIKYGARVQDQISVYELAYKCKVWAFNQGYYLTIYNDAVDIILKRNCKIIANITNGSFMYDVKLTFKACELILKEINK